MSLTPHERNVLKGKIRQAFRQSERFKRTLDAARVELPPALKKDGTPGKRNQVRYRCAHCGGLFPQKWVSVDHISPVIPLWKKEHDMLIQDVVYGIYCDESNLQVLCSTPLKFLLKGERSCHSKKTNRENFIRSCFEQNGVPDQFNPAILIEDYSNRYDHYLLEKEKKEQEKLARKKAKEEKRKLKRG